MNHHVYFKKLAQLPIEHIQQVRQHHHKVVSVDFSRKMYKALSKEKATVRLTIYPKVNHNSWENAFSDPDLIYWLFSNKR